MAKEKRTKQRGGLAPDKYLSETQLRKLRRHVKDKAELARMRGASRAVIDELIVELLVNTGLRASELCKLNIGDLPVKHGKDGVWVRDGKGKVSRTVDISAKLKKRIERFVKLYRKGARANSALLVSERGDRIIYRSIYSKIKRIGDQAGIGKLHPHMLRHTYLTRLSQHREGPQIRPGSSWTCKPDHNGYLRQDGQQGQETAGKGPGR